MRQNTNIRFIRRRLAFFIVALFLSGLTVLPAESELRFGLGLVPADSTVGAWLRTLLEAYIDMRSDAPFLLYGYDWLAFAHFVLAALFIGPWRDPVRNRWVLEFGLGACIAIFPFAFIAGAVRGIPFWWQLVDCSFGVVGFAVLWPCYRRVQQLEADSLTRKTTVHETPLVPLAR
ncbi:hypothetical protein [Flaviaesturariibacter amylovorans]|uniref:Cytoplasmic membrane protein n=1 Tax=Flaviaesturariibacter amylovorans TaxID=1084520 RepID=A0ABP8GDQ9_9BACT